MLISFFFFVYYVFLTTSFYSFITKANQASMDLNNSTYFEREFELCTTLGQGSFGDVFKVRSRSDGQTYAIKRTKAPFYGNKDKYVFAY